RGGAAPPRRPPAGRARTGRALPGRRWCSGTANRRLAGAGTATARGSTSTSSGLLAPLRQARDAVPVLVSGIITRSRAWRFGEGGGSAARLCPGAVDSLTNPAQGPALDAAGFKKSWRTVRRPNPTGPERGFRCGSGKIAGSPRKKLPNEPFRRPFRRPPQARPADGGHRRLRDRLPGRLARGLRHRPLHAARLAGLRDAGDEVRGLRPPPRPDRAGRHAAG